MHNLLEKLGYTPTDKLLIIHADDAGLCYAENRATKKALKEGIVNSYSIMVPCPWAYEMATFAKENPAFDCGIHLTLTCEWKHYKFGPVLPANEVPSLVDGNGHFYPKRAMMKENANPEEVKKELIAQVERALSWGIQPTHLDSHMFTTGLTKGIIQVYREVGKLFKIPIFLSRQLLNDFKMDTEQYLRETDFTIDNVFTGEWKWFEGEGLAAYYDWSLKNLKEGFNIILIHPAYDDAEMQGVAIDHPNFGAAWRQCDLDYFTSNRTKNLIEKYNIKLITWSNLKAILHKD
ncbi:polysaccharide deacetylase family protein [Galbibacter pacificus]|uniref:Polysaccharide deacetylase family protein n=1 Tax=Galbibacter pacificus TaxID=2996052 RepID=A0ABT6FTF0_9FLAO|nr:polysaccharide deacetylase family protein [Galbibacter pacificus]MDG3583045.1 polysaccharide deacetylase family protein [Galbibacter pacificus]MDG3586526.1 polysaccharide deacetylase family protein [Galbibacter pacificus]